MELFDRLMAVYTSLSDSDLENFLYKFNLGKLLTFKGIAGGVTNSNFFVETEFGNFVLTIFEELSFKDLPFYFDFMNHLAKNNFPSPMPISDNDGVTIHSLKDKPAVLLSKIPGEIFSDINSSKIESLGTALAKMHLLSSTFKFERENDRSIEWMKSTFLKLKDKLDVEICSILDHEFNYLQNAPKNLPKGIIHADLFRDNVLFVENDIGGIIDYYYACYDFYIYDIAIVINDWCINADGSINEEYKNIFFQAYESERKITMEEWSALKYFLRLASMRFLISRYHDLFYQKVSEMNKPKDPKFFLKILQQRMMG